MRECASVAEQFAQIVGNFSFNGNPPPFPALANGQYPMPIPPSLPAAEETGKKRKSRGLGEIKWLLHENKRIAEQMEVSLTEEMQAVCGEVNRHVQGSDEAIQTAKCVLFLVLWCIRCWYLFRMLSTELSRLQAGTIAAWQEACNNGWIYCAVETGRPPEGAERETGRGPLGPLLWVTSGAAGGGMAYWGC